MDVCYNRVNRKYDYLIFYFSAISIERRSESTIYIRYSDGLRVKLEGLLSVYVTVEQTYMKQVRGLCGTYTNLLEDELLLPDGSLSTSVTNFANEWRSDSSVSDIKQIASSRKMFMLIQCPTSSVQADPCDTSDLLNAAVKACGVIVDPYDSFRICSYVINNTLSYEACKRDHCAAAKYGKDAQQDALCAAFAAVAHDCADRSIYVSWRKTDRCPKSCQNERVYTDCASTYQQTCQNYGQDFANLLDLTSDCAPGCVCPEGTVIDLGRNTTCIKPDQCTCYFHGKYYLPRQTISIDCNNW